MTSSYLTNLQRNIIVALTLTASFLSVLMMFLLITAFPKIMQEFSINSTEAQWLTTSFMVTSAILIPITAYFIDTFKTRTVMLSALSIFLIGTVISLFATSFPVLLTGRIIQGAGSGVMIPLMQTILYLVYPREKRGFAMGMAAMVINVAPAVGPPLSGVLIKYFGWRSLFFIPLSMTAVILILVIFFMHNVTNQKETKIDVLSIGLSSIGFGGMLYGFNRWQETELFNVITFGSLVIGAISLTLFAIRQFRLEKPILELRVLKVPIFSLVAFISILAFSLLIAIETIIPMFVQNAQQFSAYYGGLVVMPGAITLAVMSLVAGNLFDKYGGRNIAVIGFALICFSAISYYFLLHLESSFTMIMFLFMIAMAGSALINMPVMTAGINALPDELIPHGTAVINTIRQFGGTFGLTFIISFITKAEAESVTLDPNNYLLGVKHAFFASFVLAVIGLVLSLFVEKTHK